jgi:hypothetical protein
VFDLVRRSTKRTGHKGETRTDFYTHPIDSVCVSPRDAFSGLKLIGLDQAPARAGNSGNPDDSAGHFATSGNQRGQFKFVVKYVRKNRNIQEV